MSTSLVFQSHRFDVIDLNGQPWLRSNQIGLAMDYKNPDLSVAKLYRQHADEFTDSMTAMVTLPTPGGPQETRIFSLRGCHLLAMFARTPVAKAFRAWVLDVLETLGEAEARQPVAPRLATKADRRPLVDLVRMWVSMAPLGYGAAFRLVNAAMGVSSVEEMTPETVQRAIGWVQARIDAIQAAPVVLPAAAPALPAVPDDLRARLRAHTHACLDFMGETCSRARMLNTEGSLLAREVYSVLEPRFATSIPGYQVRERVHDSLTTFASRGVHAMEVGADNLYLTARLMEGLAAIR
ncbi:Bro-N domain-containing protein [Nitratidesulfovibrio sp. SRB-5]|uniref:BRO-N domain-containing protein n=1 Tax=Nitratidesulfovibrio sp. SRB-5 TaxID=2872636 RepID=UPI0010257F9C|nr:Bro-N domain-containing protein [Nitratidesulfovibrio sp. SRB-5]MBZ2172196.1 Bro-N domain-containing protein [Nitratidesulfovibrio sp. SRB-5]RXF77390.1 hypothetical protein EKK70_07000 [Desulfovibrio sp. DS-1]